MTLRDAVSIRRVAVDVGLEVRRALDRKFAKSPYLARQPSVFGDRQLVTGVPGTMFGGLQHMQNLTVNAEKTIYTGSVHWNGVLRPVWEI